jgi:hypothetical protein
MGTLLACHPCHPPCPPYNQVGQGTKGKGLVCPRGTLTQEHVVCKHVEEAEKDMGRQHPRVDRTKAERHHTSVRGQRERWRELVARSSVVAQRSSRLRDR